MECLPGGGSGVSLTAVSVSLLYSRPTAGKGSACVLLQTDLRNFIVLLIQPIRALDDDESADHRKLPVSAYGRRPVYGKSCIFFGVMIFIQLFLH